MNGLPATPDVLYPDSDGRRMAENTQQYRWIVTLQGNLDLLYRSRPDVFVAGDHLIYAQQGNPKRRAAPDVYVAFGRPKGDRGSYKVWEEGGVFPQVVVEVLSPGNRAKELRRKFHFYQRYGAEEYVVIDPDRHTLTVYHRTPAGRLARRPTAPDHVSPRLGVRFAQEPDGLTVWYPTGERFLTMMELGARAEEEKQRADAERRRAEEEKQRADAERRRAEAERRRADAERRRADAEQVRGDAEQVRGDAEKDRADRLAAKLRSLGLDPDAP